MKKKIAHGSTQLGIMLIVTIATQAFLLLKNSLVAANFGVGIEIDAFNLATNLSNFVFSFIGAGIGTVLIPFLKRQEDRESINIFITVIYLIGILFVLIMVGNRNLIFATINKTGDNHFIELTSNLLLATILIAFINSINTMLSAVLEFYNVFIYQKLINLLTNIVGISFLIFCGFFSIKQYVWVLGMIALATVVINYFRLTREDFRYRPQVNLKDSTFKTMLRLMGPAVLSTAIYQLSILIDTVIAAKLPLGSISILNYSNTIIAMFNMLILANLSSFFYPKLVQVENEMERQKKLFDYIIVILAILFFFVSAFLTVGLEGIAILLQRGKFTSDDTYIVFIASSLYIIQLPTNGARDLFYKYFYVKKNTFIPFRNSLSASLVNVVFSILLSIKFGLYGIIIGTVISSFTSLLTISISFYRENHTIYPMKNYFWEAIKIFIAAIITFYVCSLLKKFLLISNIYISVVIFGSVSLVLYAILLYIFRSKFFKIKF